jgi:hypothetical protein
LKIFFPFNISFSFSTITQHSLKRLWKIHTYIQPNFFPCETTAMKDFLIVVLATLMEQRYGGVKAG